MGRCRKGDEAVMAFEQAWSVVKAMNPEWMEYYNMLESIREA